MITGGGQGLDYVIKIFSATEKNAMVNIIWISTDPGKVYIYSQIGLLKLSKVWNFRVNSHSRQKYVKFSRCSHSGGDGARWCVNSRSRQKCVNFPCWSHSGGRPKWLSNHMGCRPMITDDSTGGGVKNPIFMITWYVNAPLNGPLGQKKSLLFLVLWFGTNPTSERARFFLV